MAKENESSRKIFSRNYKLLLFLTIPITALGIYFAGIFTIPILVSLSNGLMLTKNELWSTVLLNVLVLGFVIYVWIMGYIESSIEFTDTNLRKKRWIGSTTINWSDVSSIFTIGRRLIIQTHSRKLEVNTIYYREPDKLIKFIQDKINL